jgi:phage prohead protease, HK97 family
MPELLTRAFHIRSADLDERTVTGIAVPWDTPVEVRDWWLGETYLEQVARGAVEDAGDVKLFAEHREVIGRVVSHRDTDEGWEITARISETTRGDDVYTLLRDGVLDRFSIGFEPLEHVETRDPQTDRLTITRTRIRVREVSLVPFPAYEDAKVTAVRSAEPASDTTPTTEGTPIMTETLERQLAAIRESHEELDRKVELVLARDASPAPAPAMRFRTAGALLKALVSKSTEAEEARAEYEQLMQRDYEGATTADTVVKPGWVGDLTRIFDASSGVLAQIFSTGVLPAEGMSIEYGELDANSVDVDEQSAEGDDLTSGKIELTSKTAPVKTYGGTSTLSRQVIERSTLPYLDHTLRALAIAAGARKKSVLRAAYNALVTARLAVADDAGAVVVEGDLDDLDAKTLTDLVIDAAIKFEAVNLPPEAVVASPEVFKHLAALETEGKRVLRVAEGDSVGTVNLPGLKGSINGLPVLCDTGATGVHMAFVNGRALRQYDSPLVQLQDERVLNLTRDYGVYRYGAVAAEIPAGVVPVKFDSGD